MYTFVEQLENLVVALLLLFGGALVTGTLDGLTWRTALVALLLVLVVRPVSGHVALLGTHLAGIPRRWAIAFFGIRGFGSVYYLSYALGHGDFSAEPALWATVAAAMLISIAAHGVTASGHAGRRPIDPARCRDRCATRPAAAQLRRRRAGLEVVEVGLRHGFTEGVHRPRVLGHVAGLAQVVVAAPALPHLHPVDRGLERGVVGVHDLGLHVDPVAQGVSIARIVFTAYCASYSIIGMSEPCVVGPK